MYNILFATSAVTGGNLELMAPVRSHSDMSMAIYLVGIGNLAVSIVHQTIRMPHRCDLYGDIGWLYFRNGGSACGATGFVELPFSIRQLFHHELQVTAVHAHCDTPDVVIFDRFILDLSVQIRQQRFDLTVRI